MQVCGATKLTIIGAHICRTKEARNWPWGSHPRVLALDAYDSHRGTALGLDSSMAIDPIFADSFESEDMTAWDASVTDSGDLDTTLES